MKFAKTNGCHPGAPMSYRRYIGLVSLGSNVGAFAVYNVAWLIAECTYQMPCHTQSTN